MIPAPPGITASYKYDTTKADGTPHTYWIERRVVAFNDDGVPLIVRKHGLEPADNFNGFDGLDDEAPETLKLIPGGGWRITYRTESDGEWSTPVLAWALKPGGDLVALDVDIDGNVMEVHRDSVKFHHPDADPIEP